MSQDLLSTTQAAKRAGVPLTTFRRWLSEGRVPGAVRNPTGRLFVPKSAIHGLLAPVPPKAGAPEAGRANAISV